MIPTPFGVAQSNSINPKLISRNTEPIRREFGGVGLADLGGELLGGRESVAPGGDGAAGIEERGPLGEEARVVVGAGAVGFWA